MPVPFKIILMRHAEARHEGKSDKARVLSPHGARQAREAGLKLKATISNCDRAIVSDASRTRQTAEHVLNSFMAKNTVYEPM